MYKLYMASFFVDSPVNQIFPAGLEDALGSGDVSVTFHFLKKIYCGGTEP